MARREGERGRREGETGRSPLVSPKQRGNGREDKGTPGRKKKGPKEMVLIKRGGHKQEDSTRKGLWGERLVHIFEFLSYLRKYIKIRLIQKYLSTMI